MSHPETAMAPPPKFKFGTKAQTLERLTGRLESARLCEQFVLTTTDWERDGSAALDRVLKTFAGKLIVVRSSADSEDRMEDSNAGAFESVTGVSCEPDEIAKAVDAVIASYGPDAEDQEVLVQEMVMDVALSGVVLTRDLDTGGPYYAINYDDFSGRTDTVTGGAESKTVLVRRRNPGALHSTRMQAIIAAAMELETICDDQELDIEFCMTHAQELFVLQVRPLAARRRWKSIPAADIDRINDGIRKSLTDKMRPEAGLHGSTTIFGEMPDWNPAEMIGTTPRPLAMSLYRHLITDRTWSLARARMGYRDVDRPLMVDFAGRPYIDIRLSFNSFLPAGLAPDLSDRLVDHQLAGLAAQPDLHDKIEFELAVTCLDLCHDERMQRLRADGFTIEDTNALTDAIRKLTIDAVAPGAEGIRRLLAETDTLLQPQTQTAPDPLDRVRALLAETLEKGTLPFSILARHGFIGVSLLNSMVDRGVLSKEDRDSFMRSIHTVAADLVRDMAAVSNGSLPEDEFLERYGHLRPGTYDILSSRYDERPDLYLGHNARPVDSEPAFAASPECAAAVEKCLREQQTDFSAGHVFDYISAAIAAREQAKFAFTRGISDALAALVEWGQSAGLSREDLSFLEVGEVLDGNIDPAGIRERIERRRHAYETARAVYLPHLIAEPDDIDVIRLLRGQATYITAEAVTARTVHVDSTSVPDLNDRIVLIESADPGYDWIFSHQISALVTKFGGANSHMAIRCAEFGLPAAIGCGEKTYADLRDAAAIELNCAARTIRAVGHTP